jgi:hypothetical protein
VTAQVSTAAPGWVELLAVLLRDTPSLPNALCRNRSDVFDVTDPALSGEAVELCRRCPERQPCRAWTHTLPERAVSGVVGGEVRAWS